MSARNFTLFGTAKRFGNVTIQRSDDKRMISVLLHGNEVLTLDTVKGLMRISNCGWCTPTTHNAINTALSQIENSPVSRVYASKGKSIVYFNDDTMQAIPLVNGTWFKLNRMEAKEAA